MSDGRDDHGAWIAQLDQALASVKDMAKLERAYYNELLEVGFTRGEALMLTASFQKALLNAGSSGEDA